MATVNAKLTDVIKQFTGDGKVNVCQWLGKAEMVGRLQKIDNMADFVPLFLDGDAYEIYDQLAAEKKADYEEIKKALISSFAMTPVQAFDVFKKRVLKEGEQPDTFLADLRRLSSLFHVESDALVACQFILGMPGQIPGQLMAIKEGSLDVGVLLVSAKQMLANHENPGSSGTSPLGAAGRSVRPWERGTSNGSGQNGSGRGHGGKGHSGASGAGGSGSGDGGQNFGPKCYGCGRRGHVQRECNTECFRCKKKGHIQWRCPENRGVSANAGSANQDPGNGQGEAPDTAPWDASPFPMGYH